MKDKTTFKSLFLLLFILTCFTGVQKAAAQYTAITDPAFEFSLFVLGHDDNPSDGQVLTANISG